MKIQVGVSNRHIHLKQEHLEILFGVGFELEKVSDLTQPPNFISNNFLKVEGPKDSFEKVRIIGPVRSYTQIEISKTDAYKLGVEPPVRESGDVVGSAPIKLVGPKGSVDLDYGCIIAERHIHIRPEQLKLYNLDSREKVNVFVNNEKGGILLNVALKVSDDAFFELHLDTDDANANLIKQNDIVDIIED